MRPIAGLDGGSVCPPQTFTPWGGPQFLLVQEEYSHKTGWWKGFHSAEPQNVWLNICSCHKLCVTLSNFKLCVIIGMLVECWCMAMSRVHMLWNVKEHENMSYCQMLLSKLLCHSFVCYPCFGVRSLDKCYLNAVCFVTCTKMGAENVGSPRSDMLGVAFMDRLVETASALIFA